MKITALDKIIGAISPAAMRNRLVARAQAEHMLSYEAAKSTRLRGYNSTLRDPESSTTGRERILMIQQARDLSENFPLFPSILRKYAMYVAGRIAYSPRTGSDDLDGIIRDAFAEWSDDCDVTGRHTLTSLAQLSVIGEKRDGECGLAWVMDGDNLRLSAIEADRIGDPYSFTPSDTNVGGFHIDPTTGKVLAVDIYRRGRESASYSLQATLPWPWFLHYFNPLRFDEYHGVTAFASTINTARDIKEIMEAALLRIKFSAYHAALITTNRGIPKPADFFDGDTVGPDGQRIREEQTGFGVLRYLGEGEDVKELKTQFPEQMIQSYLQMMIRMIAQGLDMPYGLAWDFSGLTGPGGRFEAAQAQRAFDQEQRNLKARLLNPIKNRVIGFLAMTGKLGPVSFSDPRIYRGEWFFPQKLTIDYGRESKANIELYRAGLITKEMIAADESMDWRELDAQVIRERKHAKSLAESAGLGYLDQHLLGPSGQVPVEVQIDDDGIIASTRDAQLQEGVDLKPPAAAVNNAKKVLRWRDEHPDEIQGMTQVGWTRANQIASGDALSAETVKRMASFARHRQNSDVSEENKSTPWKDAGYVAWLGWGGTSGIDWAIRKSAELDRAKS